MFNKKRFRKQAEKLIEEERRQNLERLEAEIDDIQNEGKILEKEGKAGAEGPGQDDWVKDVVKEALEN